MKRNKKLTVIVVTSFALGINSTSWAKESRHSSNYGERKEIKEVAHIWIENFEGETLGQIKELNVDLSSGRIVEVFVSSGGFLGLGERITPVPPSAFLPGGKSSYQLDVSREKFNAAPQIDFSEWRAGADYRTRIAGSYLYFKQTPYFVQEGAPAPRAGDYAVESLGRLERSSNLVGMPIYSRLEKLGSVWSYSANILEGKLVSLRATVPGVSQTKRVLPATALSFSLDGKALVINSSREDLYNQPKADYVQAGYGQPANVREEPFSGQISKAEIMTRAEVMDAQRAEAIKKSVQDARIDSRDLQIETVNGRVILRGVVKTEAEKKRIGDLAKQSVESEQIGNHIDVRSDL